MREGGLAEIMKLFYTNFRVKHNNGVQKKNRDMDKNNNKQIQFIAHNPVAHSRISRQTAAQCIYFASIYASPSRQKKTPPNIVYSSRSHKKTHIR